MSRAAVLATLLVAVGAAAAWWRARDGALRAAGPPPAVGATAAADVARFVPEDADVLLLELTTPHCAPCRSARAVLDAVAADRSAVAVAAVDLADAHDLVVAHGVLRAPTTLVVARDGAVLGRVAGVPRAADLAQLLDATMPTAA